MVSHNSQEVHMSAGERLPGTPEPEYYWEGSQGMRIAGDTWGPRSGLPVILQHGGGQTRHAWKRTGEVLGEAGFHAIAFDSRGHGDSDWSPEADYSQDAMVGDLVAVVSALGLSKVVLVGASMGGGTSLVAAGDRMVDAAALVLVDIAPKIALPGVQVITAFMTRNLAGFASLEEVADAIASYQPHRERPKSIEGLAKNVRLSADGRFYWHWDPRMLDGHRDLALRETRLQACARALRVPSLLVRGGMSDVLTDEGVHDYLTQARYSEYLNIIGAGHMVAGDRNDMFGTAVVEFLTRPGLLAPDGLQSKQRDRLVKQLNAPDLNDIP